jgi:hypothetical protein
MTKNYKFSCRELEEFKTCKLGGAYLFLMIDDILIENVVQKMFYYRK